MGMGIDLSYISHDATWFEAYTGTSTIDIEYNKSLDCRRPCLEDDSMEEVII